MKSCFKKSELTCTFLNFQTLSFRTIAVVKYPLFLTSVNIKDDNSLTCHPYSNPADLHTHCSLFELKVGIGVVLPVCRHEKIHWFEILELSFNKKGH